MLGGGSETPSGVAISPGRSSRARNTINKSRLPSPRRETRSGRRIRGGCRASFPIAGARATKIDRLRPRDGSRVWRANDGSSGGGERGGEATARNALFEATRCVATSNKSAPARSGRPNPKTPRRRRRRRVFSRPAPRPAWEEEEEEGEFSDLHFSYGRWCLWPGRGCGGGLFVKLVTMRGRKYLSPRENENEEEGAAPMFLPPRS